MSFSLSFSDIYLVVHDGVKLVNQYRRAPREIEALKKEVASFVLQLRQYDSRNGADPVQAPEEPSLQPLIRECISVLDDIQQHLVKARPSVGPMASVKRHLKRAFFNAAELSPLWDRVERCSNRILLQIALQHYAEQKEAKCIKTLEDLSPRLEVPPESGLPGTFMHILESEELRRWESTKGQGLLCYGGPGVGKSTVVAMEADRLRDMYSDDFDVAVVCIHVGINLHLLETIHHVHRAILRQLYEKKLYLLANLPKLHPCRDQDHRLFEVLDSAIKAFARVFLLVDGIEEFRASKTIVEELRKLLCPILSEPRVNLFLAATTIPPYLDVEKLATWFKLEIRTLDVDIAKFVERKAVDLPECLLEDDRPLDEVVRDVIDVSNGVFLLASLLMNEAADIITLGEFKTMIGAIRYGRSRNSNALTAMYDYVMQKFDRLNPRVKTRAMDVMTWVLLASRPLQGDELCHAFELKHEPGPVKVEELVRDTRGFIKHFEGNGILGPYHATVRSYFTETQKENIPTLQADMTKTLVKCLATSRAKDGIYEYAAANWGDHAALASQDSDMFAKIVNFLRNKPRVEESCEFLLRQYFRGRHPKAVSGVHVAAHFGLVPYLAALAADGVELDDRDENGETPLLWAARQRQESAVMWLLKQGVDVNVRDFKLASTLHYAALYMWERPLRFLLGCKAEITVDVENMTPLHYAVRSGWEEGVAILLDAGVHVDLSVRRVSYQQAYRDGRQVYEINDTKTQLSVPEGASDCLGLTPLHLASLCGQWEMVRLLLGRGANPAARSEHGETPLHLAVSRRLKSPGGDWCEPDGWNEDYSRIEFGLDFIDPLDQDNYADSCEFILKEICGLVIDLLSHRDTKVNVRTVEGSQALHLVDYSGWQSASLVRELIRHGADPSGRNSVQETPLLLACKNGNAEAARLLLDGGADVTEADAEGRNALHLAAMSGHEETLCLVLETSKFRGRGQIVSVDKDGRNVLHHALVGGITCCEVLKQLLDAGAEINRADRDGVTPLVAYLRVWLAFRRRGPVELLLDWKADVGYKTPDGLGLGHLYAHCVELEVEVLELLSNAGLDLSALDGKGRTILHHTARSGSLTGPVLEYLLREVKLSLDTVDSAGRKPLDYAREMSSKTHHPLLFDPGRWSRTEKIFLEQWPLPIEVM